jgi:PAS domain S-box-containing protein
MAEATSPIAQRLLSLALRHARTHALVLLDPDGKIVGWLAGAERLFGYSPDEIFGSDLAVLFTAEDVTNDLARTELETAIGSGEAEDDRWQVRKDGGRVWISGTLTPLRDEQGNLAGFCKIMRNRTDQKTQVETLESRIESLRHAHDRKNNFISTLAHELRNPLAAMSNAVELLSQKGPLPPDHLHFAAGIVSRQVEFMRRMVNDLLELAGSAAGKVSLNVERLNLQDVITGAVEVTRASIDRHGHHLHQLMPGSPIHLDGDSVRLQQVVVNLIENAAKYTPENGNVWVKVTSEADEAVVRVQDDGLGIAPEVMPHIFDLFTQAENRGTSDGGLGIGLSVVKDTVEMHGGTVQVVSDGPGKGSEFIVRLPLQAPSLRRPEFGKG